MSSARSRKQQQDLAARIDQLKVQLNRLEQEMDKIRADGEVASLGIGLCVFKPRDRTQ